MDPRRVAVLALVAGCGSGDPARPVTGGAVDGVEELSEPLTDLTAQCAYSAAAKTLTLTLAAGDVAVFTREPSNAITINAFPCGGASTSTVTQISVAGSTGDEIVILDLRGGAFAPGVSGRAGISVDLAGGTGDSVKVIGTLGADRIVYGASGLALDGDAWLDVAPANTEVFTVSLVDGNDTFSGAGNAATGTPFALPLDVYGGDGNDSLRGGAADDALHGGPDDDTLVAGDASDGADVMAGDAGTDTADYSARRLAVTISLDGAANDGDASEGDNVTSTVEIIKGGLGDDTLSGGSGADTIYGGPGNDRIAGGAGADHLYGDSGDDLFDMGATAGGADTISGGAGTDAIAFVARTQAVTVVVDGATPSGQTGEAVAVMADVETVIGGPLNDSITGSVAADSLYGGGGNDQLSGGAGDDRLVGGPGADALNGGPGADRFDEGAVKNGDDTLIGGTGVDLADYSARTHALVIAMDGVTPGGEPILPAPPPLGLAAASVPPIARALQPPGAARFGDLVSDPERDAPHVLARQLLPASGAGALAPAIAQSRVIYLNRNGVTVHPGVNDSRTNASSIATSLTALQGWSTSDANWSATVACLSSMFQRWDVVVTDQDPGNVSHIEAVFARSPSSLGLPANVAGVSPFTLDCANIDNSMVYTFTDLLGNDPQLVCEVMAQEIAHSYGLDHELLASDPMTYLTRTGNRTFQDQDASCGEFTPRVCGINGSSCRASQNSVALLTARLGLAQNLPDFTVALPTAAATLAPGASTTLTVTTSAVGGATSTLSLAVVDLPAGVTAAFGASSIPAGTSTTLTLTASGGAAAAGAAISVTATAGGRTRSAHGTVEVVATGWSTDADRVGTDIENLIGGSGDDTLTGNEGDNQIEGGAGDDTIDGRGGDDVIDGGLGNDSIDCGAGDADIALDPTSTKVRCEL